ncbi:MAG: pyruvate dehydrogenase E2 component (dihydrolipoamide acetyltransferase) [Zhongshania sp.]|jgi:pyruvate dehydrogenase E2 component (dihydrolipoamide acetyltransferase)
MNPKTVSEKIDELPLQPMIDHGVFGEVEELPLSKVQQYVGAFLHRNWLSIPHVTHNDEVDITDLERFRKTLNESASIKITLLPLLIRAVTKSLKAYPVFNSSLSSSGDKVVLKKFYHIGFAAESKHGLLVPVIKDADKKSLTEVAAEIGAKATMAGGRGLPMSDMEGGSFTISALGGLGGTSFTPIINAPEVAILGVTKSKWVQQRMADGSAEWRLMLPLSLSYDHRVINGADAARFVTHLGSVLADSAEYDSWKV